MKERLIVWLVAWVTLLASLCSVVTFCLFHPNWDERLAEHFIDKGWTPHFVAQMEGK